MADPVPVAGEVAPGFEAVRAVFADNFHRPGDFAEFGAALAVYRHGRLVVDLWGGHADRDRARPWRRDTLVNVWSATKAITATAAALLVDRGHIAYDDPIAEVWPAFAQADKGAITVAQALSHQAGLPGFIEPTTLEDLFDWDGSVGRLERQAPVWTPGTETSYHAQTFGWLVGEVVRRVSGRSIGDFVAEEIAGPLDAEFYIGLPEALDDRVAEILAPRRPPTPSGAPPTPIALTASRNPSISPSAPNRRGWRAAQIPAANAQASALGLARLYAALDDDGAHPLLSAETLARMTMAAAPAGRRDQFLGFVDCWGMGVLLNTPGLYGPNPRAFGHSGWGGSFGCADPGAGLAIGYVCNRMGPDLVGDPRAASLRAAIAACAGA